MRLLATSIAAIAARCSLALILEGSPAAAQEPPVPGPAAAQDQSSPGPPTTKDDAARQHWDVGIEFYQNGEYEGARIEFEAGLKLNGNPEWLFNLARTALKQGKIEDARAFAARYSLAKGHSDKDARELAAMIPPPAERPAPAKRDSRGTRATPLAWALVGVGGASLVGSVVCSSLGVGLARSVESTPLTLSDFQAAQADGAKLNAASGTLFGIGITLVAGGATWLLVRRFHPGPAQAQ